MGWRWMARVLWISSPWIRGLWQERALWCFCAALPLSALLAPCAEELQLLLPVFSDGACFCSRLRSSLNGILDHLVILGNNDVIDHTARQFQFLIPPTKFLSLVILQIIEAHIVFFVINKSQFNPQCMTIQFVDCPPPPKPPSLLYLGVKRKEK